MKTPSILRACVVASPTTDDAPSTSSRRRSSSSQPQPGPEGLSSRHRGPEAPEGQRPRKKGLIGKIKHVSHAVAVRVGISESRSAKAAAEAAAAAAAAGSQRPPETLTPPSPTGVDLYRERQAVAALAALTQNRRDSQSLDTVSQPHHSEPPPQIVNEPPVVQQPPVIRQPAAPQFTWVEPPQFRHPEITPVVPQLTLDSSLPVQPLVHREIPLVVEPEIRPVSPLSQRTRRHASSPPPEGNPGSSGIQGNERRVPSKPLTYRSRQVAPTETPPLTPPLTPPVTPRQPVPTVAAPLERTELPSRREVFAASAKQAVDKLHLPQAGKAVANDSLVRELGATAHTLLKPLQLAKDTGATLLQAGSSWLNRSRQSSELLQDALQGAGVDLSHPAQQEFAHEVAVDYGEHAATVLDTALPMVHSILKIGVAGTAMAFGAGRNSGLAAGDALGRLERGAAQATGVRAGPERPAATLQSGTAAKLMGAGVQQLVLGSLTGAVGNLTGQYLAAPLVNMIPRQFAPIDLRAVLPDKTVDLMNQLQPGAGDALRKQVQEAQRDVATINSASNVRLGQIAFDAITAARWAAQGGLPLGVAGQVGIGLAVSSSAGMVIGAVMASRQSVATHEVPDLTALRAAAAAHAADPGSDGAAVLAQVARNAVPLFFPKQTVAAADPQAPGDIETGHGAPVVNADADQRGRLARMRDTAQWAVQQAARPLVAVGQAWGQSLGASPLIEPAAPGTDGAITAGRVVATASNVAASVVNRAGEMAKATLSTQAWSTASAMLASATDGPAREFILAMGNAVGIHAAIKPWFDSLVSEIPQGDAKIRAHREQVANP